MDGMPARIVAILLVRQNVQDAERISNQLGKRALFVVLKSSKNCYLNGAIFFDIHQSIARPLSSRCRHTSS